MDIIKPLFTITATSIGGRNGHSKTNDEALNVDLSVPKEMGGPGKQDTITPEHLFATGYASCFAGALDYVAKQHNKDASKANVQCSVSIGKREPIGFALAVKLRIEDTNLSQADLSEFVKETHEKICPYSNATRNNIEVELEVIGMSER
jgi:osmotically inducible protein OsmC